MPRLKNAVPKYRKHRASGQAVVTLNGRDFYLGPHQTEVSKREYDRLISEWLANNRRLPQQTDSLTTIDELLAAYWQHAQNYYVSLDGKPTSELYAYFQVLKTLRSHYGGTNVDNFGPLALKAIREKFISYGLARKHINQKIGRIVRIFKWGVANELVPAEVFHALQTVPGLKKGRSAAKETPPVKPVAEALVEAVKPYVCRQVWAMIQLQYLSGMRSGEVTIMRPCDIDMQGDVWVYRPTHHKTDYQDKERLIFLGGKAQSIIKPFLDRDDEAYLFSPREAMEERNALRRKNRKTPMTPSQARMTCPLHPGPDSER